MLITMSHFQSIVILILMCATFVKSTIDTTVYSQPSSCTTTQYYDTLTRLCIDCGKPELVRSTDGFSCACTTGYRYTKNAGGNQVQCAQCLATQAVTSDGWSCNTCSGTCPTTCAATQYSAERNADGTLQNKQCVPCQGATFPSSDGLRCVPCTAFYSLNATASNSCNCTGGLLTGGLCLPSQTSMDTYNNVFPSNFPSTSTTSTPATSAFFAANRIAALFMCNSAYNNMTACQVLANLCTLRLYDLTNANAANHPCSNLYSVASGSTTTGLPGSFSLFYTKDAATSDLSTTKLTTVFNRTSQIKLLLAGFTPAGQFLGYMNATGGKLQLCKDKPNVLNAAYSFGTNYTQSCTINADDLFSDTNYPLVFYDPYIQFSDVAGTAKVHPVPIVMTQLFSTDGSQPNQGATANWIMTRRLFLVDNLSARTLSGQAGEAAAFVRYASTITLTITSQSTSTSRTGLIAPPYLTVTYGTAYYGRGSTVQVTFSIVYQASSDSLTQFKRDVDIAMGTLCALATVYAIMRTAFWARRTGLSKVDFVVILKLIGYASGSIANMFLLVMFGVSFYFILFYKNQDIFSLFLPTGSDATFFTVYIAVAFVLKCISIMHLIISQCTIDIFFIDWERPRFSSAPKLGGPAAVPLQPGSQPQAQPSGPQQGDARTGPPPDSAPLSPEDEVSIWRTYFVANEWNEIQTHRKTFPVLTLFLVLFFMKVVGFENMASSDPVGTVYVDPSGYRSDQNLMFRFAIFVCIFVISGVVQWTFNLLLYEKLIEDKLRNYVDLCSVSNVSVFIMSNKQFGYYIHGQSVHGRADVGLHEMYRKLNNEKNDTVPLRGLEADSEHQTYMMALPKYMRDTFDRLYTPFSEGKSVEKGLETYRALNKFLVQFVSRDDPEHNNYRFVDHKLLEDILDGEFEEASVEGRFYRDNGTSFGNVLFYGSELTLFSFEILLFAVVDLGLQNTVLDTIITWAVWLIIQAIRDSAGRRNLAQKTLVDDRFLI